MSKKVVRVVNDVDQCLAEKYEKHDAVDLAEWEGGEVVRGTLVDAVNRSKQLRAGKKRVTLYLYEEDIEKAKGIAEAQGLRYQTLIASLLNQSLRHHANAKK